MTAALSRPYWATRLYKAAPLRAIVSVEDPRESNLHCTHLVALECGHKMLTRLRREVMTPDTYGVTRPFPAHLLDAERCGKMLPRQRCKECIEKAYPELRRLNHAGRYEDRDCSAADLARLIAHENGDKVPPIAPWTPS